MRRTGAEEHVRAADGERASEHEPISRPVRLPLGRDDELAAGVHEVQNALTAVLGWVDLARGSNDPALRARALEVIQAGIERARTLVAGLADSSERFGVRTRPFSAARVVAEAYEFLLPRCTSAGVTLTMSPGVPDVVALGDPDRLVQVLTNLVLNAVDAILALPAREAGRGRIEIALGCDEGYVSISVHDDGTGMDEATRARAFEPYFTTHPTAGEGRKAGTGLGLAITRALVTAMRGRLSLESTPGQGTTVTVTLAREGVLPSVSPPPEERGLPPGTRILVVDDEPAIRELLEVALALRGAAVTMAATLGEARHALAHHAFDVALVDETLGAHDSGAALVVDLARAMPNMALVLMTGAPSVEHLPSEACRWLLRKPFSLDEVVRLIARALEASAGMPRGSSG